MAFTQDPSVINVSPTAEPFQTIVPDDGLVTLEQVMALTQMKKASIYNNVALGTFPAPIKVGRGNRWLRSELVDYLMQRVIERNQRLHAAQAARAKENAASL